MNNIEEQILNGYVRDYYVEMASYQLLGMMLDESFVKERLNMFGITHMYIYGGTYMSIQLYRAGKKYTNIKGIVDKSGKIVLNEEIPVIILKEFQNQYNGEKIIITPIRFYKEIVKELSSFVSEKDLISIGELLLGVV